MQLTGSASLPAANELSVDSQIGASNEPIKPVFSSHYDRPATCGEKSARSIQGDSRTLEKTAGPALEDNKNKDFMSLQTREHMRNLLSSLSDDFRIANDKLLKLAL